MGYQTNLMVYGPGRYQFLDIAKYGIGLKRRAYSVQGYYDSSSEAIGFNFQIYNFDYDGISPKF